MIRIDLRKEELESAPESPFKDIDSSHPYFKQILELYERRILSGYEDGNFRPNEQLTRAEFIKVALGSTNCIDCSMPTDPQRDLYSPVRPFPDVNLPSWYYFCVWIAKDQIGEDSTQSVAGHCRWQGDQGSANY